MKKIMLCIFLLFCLMSNSFSQEVIIQNTKYNRSIIKPGTSIKFIDYNLPEFDVAYYDATANIRKVISGNEVKYFCQIYKDADSYKIFGTICEEDLLEVIKALQNLQNEAPSDLAQKPDYIENYFDTKEGFSLGYLIRGEAISWYTVLDKYSTKDSYLYFENVETLVSLFNNAKNKIDSLKK